MKRKASTKTPLPIRVSGAKSRRASAIIKIRNPARQRASAGVPQEPTVFTMAAALLVFAMVALVVALKS